MPHLQFVISSEGTVALLRTKTLIIYNKDLQDSVRNETIIPLILYCPKIKVQHHYITLAPVTIICRKSFYNKKSEYTTYLNRVKETVNIRHPHASQYIK